MRNLQKPILNKVWYDRIIAAKTIPGTVLQLKGLEPSIKKWYKEYSSNARAGTIDIYSLTLTLVGDRKVLQDCYDQGAEMLRLKEYIRGKQERHLKYICQYCMVGISDSFDHYLPQTPFPEFSVLSNNLLPACDHCNRRKWQHWKNPAGERIILNLYYDVIPTQQFLFCNIIFSGGVPVANFKYQNPNGINVNVYNHIVRHFDKLKVIARIHSVCDTQIETIGIELSGLLTTHNLTTISTFLLAQAVDLKIRYGNNYCWAILKESMANNPRYLRYIGFV